MAELREVAGRWEAQAQLGLAQAEKLKDLLEESATWDAAHDAAGAAGAEPGSREAATDGGWHGVGRQALSTDCTVAAWAACGLPSVCCTNSHHASGLACCPADTVGSPAGVEPGRGEGGSAEQLEARCARLQRELLLEKTKTAQLELQVHRCWCLAVAWHCTECLLPGPGLPPGWGDFEP